ncbi:hypothetical protein Hanom_Chr00s082953g01794991 [Helianthus anomalus]
MIMVTDVNNNDDGVDFRRVSLMLTMMKMLVVFRSWLDCGTPVRPSRKQA